MRVWLYARLSKDEDAEQNSLQNQEKICRAFALRQGHTIEGSSVDDNISGMRFSRQGLDEISAAAESGRMEAVIVKDLSRLGGTKPRLHFISITCENEVCGCYQSQKDWIPSKILTIW